MKGNVYTVLLTFSVGLNFFIIKRWGKSLILDASKLPTKSKSHYINTILRIL